MKNGNRLVSVIPTKSGTGIVVRKSKGDLSIEDVMEALRDTPYEDDDFALFVRVPVFNGYYGEEKPFSSVTLYRITNADNCPACARNLQELRDKYFEEGYKYGLDTAGGE